MSTPLIILDLSTVDVKNPDEVQQAFTDIEYAINYINTAIRELENAQ